MSQNYKGLFEDWEIAIAKKLINEFRREWEYLEREEFDDLLQECLIHWMEVKDKYDPNREASPKTFVAKIIRNKLGNIKDRVYTEKRKTLIYETVSLNSPISDDKNAPSFEEQIPANNHESLKLKTVLSIAIDKLTPQQKELCRLLRVEGMNIYEASKHLKAHHSKVYREVKRIREIFEKQGLRQFLK